VNLKGRLQTILWAFAGLVACATLFLVMGQRDSRSNPSTNHYGPSGTRALAEMLTRDGYQVRVESRSKPKFGKDEMVIGILRGEDVLLSAEEVTRNSNVESLIRNYADSGHTVILAHVASDFRTTSLAAAPLKTRNTITGKELTAFAGAAFEFEFGGRKPEGTLIWDGAWQADVSTRGKGTVIHLSNALPMTNRFIDRADNSELMMSLIRAFAKPGQDITFAEGGFAPEDPGLLATIGPGAVAGWYQFLLLFAVIAYVGGRRLGLPEFRPRRQRGSRDLLTATADTLARSRNSKLALRTQLTTASAFADRWLVDHKTKELPTPFQQAMANAYAALQEKKLPDQVAQKLCLDIDRELAELARNEGKGSSLAGMPKR